MEDYRAAYHSICNGLYDNHIMVRLISYKTKNIDNSTVDKEYVNLLSKESSFLGRKLCLNINRYLPSIGSDNKIFHINGVWLPLNWWISRYTDRNKIPLIVTHRGQLCDNALKSKRLKKKLAYDIYGRKILKRASCVIATSEKEAIDLKNLKLDTPIAIVPNAIDINRYKKIPVANDLHKGRRIALFVSRINPLKGLDVLIKAWSRLPETMKSEWELHIVGNGDPKDYVNHIKELIEKYSESGNIFLFPPMYGEDKIIEYSNSNIFILPSYTENFGMVVAEALAMELPVITTRNTPWNCLEKIHAGWWIDLNEENLCTTLKEALSYSNSALGEMGRRGRAYVANNYTLDNSIKSLISIYKWVLGKGPEPECIFHH